MSNLSGKLEFERIESGFFRKYKATEPDGTVFQGTLILSGQTLPMRDLMKSIACKPSRIIWPTNEPEAERDFNLLREGKIAESEANSLARDVFRALSFIGFALKPPPEDRRQILKNLPPSIKINASLFP